jgi:hypothetical protein
MASEEITGGTKEEIREMREGFQTEPLFEDHGISFETAYCLRKITKQPDDYEGPERFCKRRAAKKDDYDGHKYSEGAYGGCCPFHGGDVAKHGKKSSHLLEDPRTAAIKHGANAKDEHLIMDFTDEEQELFDSIMHDWPEVYDWPPRSEDPARYRILRRVAVNEVRAMREESYIDNHEVHEEPVFDEQGIEVENPLSREYRLLMSEVTNQMKELGLTPKERQKMDTLESQAEKDDALTRVAGDALDGDEEYDPDQFNE